MFILGLLLSVVMEIWPVLNGNLKRIDLIAASSEDMAAKEVIRLYVKGKYGQEKNIGLGAKISIGLDRK